MQHTGARVLFVYYKIDQLKADEFLPLVRRLQHQAEQTWPNLSCELMQRPTASPSGQCTWLEVYRHADALSDQMIDDIARMAHELQLPAPRLCELFTAF